MKCKITMMKKDLKYETNQVSNSLITDHYRLSYSRIRSNKTKGRICKMMRYVCNLKMSMMMGM